MLSSRVRPRRSLIFVPGLQPDMFPKALRTDADMVCIDLEDAIAPEDKDEARSRTLALLAGSPDMNGIECLVRINSLRTPEGLRDVTAILESAPPPPALMLPKIKSADEVGLLDELLSGPHHDIRFHVIIETNEGLRACHDIAAACERIDSLLFGAVDMAAELRIAGGWEPLLYARSRLVHAAAGSGVDLIDVPFLDLDDMEGLRRECAAVAALGFTGKANIHPKQIAVVNAAFTPDAEAVAQARRIIAAFEESAGGLVVVDGKLVEKPVLRSMHRIVAIAEKSGPG